MEEQELAFHRKYRPNKLSKFIGNEIIVNQMLSALRSPTIPQIIMLRGPAGCGKTSFGRLIVKEVRCEDRDPMIGACCTCDSCIAIDDYIETGSTDRLMDITEVDVGDSNRTADVERIIEESSMPSMSGDWRIYLLDEMQQMSKPAQTRLLKTFEEPPDHVMFIICTTNPEAILDTIKTRCQYEFVVKKPKKSELANLLATVCESEGIKYEAKALNLIAKFSNLVPRRALVNLQKIVRTNGDCTYAGAVEVLNVIIDTFYFEFYNTLLKQKDIYKYLAYVANLKENTDLKDFMTGLIEFSVEGIYNTNGVVDSDIDSFELKAFREIFSQFSGSEIAHLLSTFLEIQKSDDIETRLILLGYTGLRGGTSATQTALPTAADIVSSKDMAIEKRVSLETYLDKKTASPEELAQATAGQFAVTSGKDLASLFKGSVRNTLDTKSKEELTSATGSENDKKF